MLQRAVQECRALRDAACSKRPAIKSAMRDPSRCQARRCEDIHETGFLVICASSNPELCSHGVRLFETE